MDSLKFKAGGRLIYRLLALDLKLSNMVTRKYLRLFGYAASALVLITAACSGPTKNKLQGKWQSKDGSVKLSITDKSFTMDDGEAIAEDYFTKGDTLFTSFQGNQPYTKFVVQKLDEHHLKLMGPDSVAVDYTR
jgi:hypothetical protein